MVIAHPLFSKLSKARGVQTWTGWGLFVVYPCNGGWAKNIFLSSSQTWHYFVCVIRNSCQQMCMSNYKLGWLDVYKIKESNNI